MPNQTCVGNTNATGSIPGYMKDVMTDVTEIGTDPVPVSNIKRFIRCPYVDGQSCPQDDSCPHWVVLLHYKGCAERVKCLLLNDIYRSLKGGVIS